MLYPKQKIEHYNPYDHQILHTFVFISGLRLLSLTALNDQLQFVLCFFQLFLCLCQG